MKKSLILVGMLSIGYAYAQEGSVGVNTDTPKATLEIVTNAKNLAGTTNEGIIIPKLTKARVVAIAADKLVEGTKVYVTDEVTAADTQFVGTGKGFYFYNGTKWVKQLSSDMDTNSELWAQRDNSGVTETYLKPADEKTDFVGYTSDRKWNLNLGNVQNDDFKYGNTALSKGLAISEVPFLTAISSDALPDTSTVGANNKFFFNHNNTLLKESHASKNPTGRYYGQENRFVIKDVTSSFRDIYGFNVSAELQSNNTVANLKGLQSLVSVGTENKVYSTTKVEDATGAYIAVMNDANTTNMFGLKAQVDSRGKATNIRAIEGLVQSQLPVNGQTPTHSVSSLRGAQFFTRLTENGEVTNNIQGIFNEVEAANNTKVNAGIRGVYSRILTKATSEPITPVIVNFMSSFVPTGTTVTTYEDYSTYPALGADAKVTNYIGYRMGSGNINASATIDKMYGMKIDNITKGTTSNFAIHTGARGIVHIGDKLGVGTETPTQRIEANGNILASEGALISRSTTPVGGFLQLDNTSKTEGQAAHRWRIYNMNSVDAENYVPGLHFWAYGADGTNLSSKMVITDAGNVGIGFGSRTSNSTQTNEKLEVNGNVKAQSFLGANGATIFPDYVFQKYYTGTSSIKSDYSFKTLSQVEDFVKTNGHLPGYKSAEAIKAQGYVDLMETQLTNVEKIEELYLHSIEQDKAIKEKDAKIQALEARLEKLEKLLK